MVENLRNYAKRITEERFPPAPLPEKTMLLVIGDKMCEKMEQILPVFHRHWPNDLQKDLCICCLDRKSEGDMIHYRFRSEKECKIADSKEEIEGINEFFRTMSWRGKEIRIIALTCAEDSDAVRAGDITAIAANFCTAVSMSVTAYTVAFLPEKIQKETEKKQVQDFFVQAMQWGKLPYQTDPIFLEYEDTEEPKSIQMSNTRLMKGLFVLDALDQNRDDTVKNLRRAQMLANLMELPDLFQINQQYLMVPGEQPTGVGYEFVLAAALEADTWKVEPPADQNLMEFQPLDFMKEAVRGVSDDLKNLLNCARFACFDKDYQTYGKIGSIGIGESQESLEKEYFGRSLLDLYEQWEDQLLTVPMPSRLKQMIRRITSLKELQVIQKKIQEIKKESHPETTVEENRSYGSKRDFESPWELQSALIDEVYLNCVERSKAKLFGVWADEILLQLKVTENDLNEQQQKVDAFFQQCRDAKKIFQKEWKDWNYTGPKMKELKLEDKLELRQRIIYAMQKENSDFQDIFQTADSFIQEAYPKKSVPKATHLCRLFEASFDRMEQRYIQNGVSKGMCISIYQPGNTGLIAIDGKENIVIENY